jgi:hypothetical protein
MQRIVIWLATFALALASLQPAFAFQAIPADCAAMQGVPDDDSRGMGCDENCLFVRGSCSGCLAITDTGSTIDFYTTGDTLGYAAEHAIQLAGFGQRPDPPPPRTFSR